MDTRQQRGIFMAATRRIVREGSTWIVPSENGKGSYKVNLHGRKPTCTCEDYETNQKKCKHIWAAALTRDREEGVEIQLPNNSDEMIKPKREQSPVKWPVYNRAKQEEKRTFLTLLRDLLQPIIDEDQIKGRRQIPLKDVTFAALMKVYLTFSARWSQCDIISCRDNGLIGYAAHYNTMLRRFATVKMTEVLATLVAETARPLSTIETNIVIDSTGLSMGQYASWYEHKHVRPNDYMLWKKLHFAAGAKTHIIIAAFPSHGDANDSPFLKPLLDGIPEEFMVKEVSADKAYASRRNMQAVQERGGMPFIPIKRGMKVYEHDPLIWQMMYLYYYQNREKFLEYYHTRSNAETVVSMIKRNFGFRLRNKSEVGQINEILAKVVCHNICVLVRSMHELGIKPEFWKK